MCPEPLHYEQALEQACNDREFLIEMLGELHMEVSQKLVGMGPKLNNPMTVKSNAHAIKGVCANFRCQHMEKMSKALELTAKPFIMDFAAKDKKSPAYLREQEAKRVRYLEKAHQEKVAQYFASLEKEFVRYETHIITVYGINIKEKYVCCAKEAEARVAHAVLATEKAADDVSADAKMVTEKVAQAKEQLEKGDTKKAERSLEQAKRSITSSMREAKVAKAAAAEAVAAAAAAEREGDMAAAAMKEEAADASKVAKTAEAQARKAQVQVAEVEKAIQTSGGGGGRKGEGSSTCRSS